MNTLLEVGVRAWYKPDTGTTPLPAFIHGTVRAEYRIQDIDPHCLGWSSLTASKYLWGLTLQPQVIVGSYEADGSGNVIRGFVVDVFPDVSGAPRVWARVGNGTVDTTIEASLEAGSEHDEWRHVVVTYSVATKVLQLYVNADNGVADATLPGPPPAPQTPVFYVANTTNPLRVGAGIVEQPVPASTPAQFFKGRIDEVALYRKPLDGSKVKITSSAEPHSRAHGGSR